MKKRLLSLALLFAALHGAAHAGLIKCKKPGGGFTFQDTPCAPDASKPEAKRPVVGEKDPTFLQKSGTGGNWDAHLVNTPRPPYVPPPQAPQIARQAEAPPKVARPSAAQRQISTADHEAQAYSDSVKAYNRGVECHNARQQLDVVNRQRPIYSLNNKGERAYVDDKDREAVAARVERDVAAACN